ncbi:E3 SUMO-protein ligase MMS21 [Rosa sericea]
MASTSSRTHGIAGRIRTAATNLYSDNQSLLGDIRKSFNVLKEVAVDLERANQFDKVKEIENAAVELLATCEHCMHLSSAIQYVGDNYEPPPENVHHAGQPMPGDDQEDIVMTSTDGNLRNTTCPVSGKAITDLEDPVCSVDCKHIYQTKEIMHYLQLKGGRGPCPIAGCPKMLQADKLVRDPLLLVEIQELRDMRKHQTADTNVIEDFTELDED